MDANNLASLPKGKDSSREETRPAHSMPQDGTTDAKSYYQTIIQGLHPFQELDAEFIRKMADHGKMVDCAKGRFVFSREKGSQWVYYLLDGAVNLIDSRFDTHTVDASSEQAKFPLNPTSPSNHSAMANRDSRFFAVERSGLETVMAWSQATIGDTIFDDVATDRVIAPTLEPLDHTVMANHETVLGAAYPPRSQSTHTAATEGADVTSDWMGALLASPLFTTIPAGNIQQLFALFESESVAKHQEIVREGEEGEYFYVIAEGKAQVELNNGHVVLLKTGQYFGEEALVGNTIRNATVRMATDGLLMRLAKKYFISLLQEPLLRSVELDDVPNLSAKVQMVDVRLPVEYRFAHVADSINIPLNRLRQSIKMLDLNTVYVITDDGGARSKVAVQLFLQSGFSSAVLNQAHMYY